MKIDAKYCLILVVFLLMIPRILVVNYEFLEPFTYSILSNARVARETGYATTDPYNLTGWWQNHANYLSERKASTLIYVFLSTVLGVDELTVARIPFLGFMLIILCFALARKVTNSIYAGIMFALIINCDFLTNLVYTSLSYHQLGLVLHLLFLMILYDTVSNARGQGRSRYIALLIIFSTLYYSYYSLEFLTVAFVAFLLVLMMLVRWRTGKHDYAEETTHSLRNLVLFMMIIFIGFDTIVLKLTDVGLSGINRLIGLVFRTIRYEAGTTYNPSFNSWYLNTRSIYIQLILAVSAILVVSMLYLFIRRKRISIENLFSLSLLLTSIAELLIYSSLGYPNARYFVKLMPLCVIIVLAKSNPLPYLKSSPRIVQKILPRLVWLKKAIVPAILLLVILTSFFAISYPPAYQYVGGKYLFSSVSPSSDWFCKHVDSKESIVLPHHSAAVTLYVVSRNGKNELISVNQYDYDVYIFLDPNETSIYNMSSSKHYGYMVLQYKSSQLPFYGAFSIVLPPIGNAVVTVESLNCIDKVYDDGANVIFRFNNMTR